MKRIFISYARENQTFAENLAADLRAIGLDVWIDSGSIQAGQQWRAAIAEGIKQSEAVVVCLSPYSVESEWVRREIFLAQSLARAIFPVMIAPCLDVMQKHEETRALLDVQIIDFTKDYFAAKTQLLSVLGSPSAEIVNPLGIQGQSLVRFRHWLRHTTER